MDAPARLEAIGLCLRGARALLLDPTLSNVSACAPTLAAAVEYFRSATPEEQAQLAPAVQDELHLLAGLLQQAAEFHGNLLNRVSAEG